MVAKSIDRADDMDSETCTGGNGEAGEIDCNDAVSQLYYYLDGELTDDRRREISVHLDRCQHCAKAADFEAELRHVIANHCRDRVPESLTARVAESIAAEQRDLEKGS